MIPLIILLTIIFILLKSYVSKFNNFRHTIVSDKDSASVITPTKLIFYSLTAWVIDFTLLFLVGLKWGTLITIIFITIVNIIPKILSLYFPYPNYKNFLINSKKLILKNTKEEYLDHPQILNILNNIEINLKK